MMAYTYVYIYISPYEEVVTYITYMQACDEDLMYMSYI